MTFRSIVLASIALAVAAGSVRAQSGIVAWGYGPGDAPPIPAGQTCVQVEAGFFHSLALLSDGSILAWGDNSHGQCNVPPLPAGLTYVQVDAGEGHSVALRSDGRIVAWGLDTDGQCDVWALPDRLRYVEVSAGNLHTLARRSDGSVVAWGNNDFHQCDVTPPPSGMTYTKISAGGHLFEFSSHSLALRSDGRIVCWGDFGGGPPLPSGLTYVDMAAGESHSVALRSDGSVVVWGDCFYPPMCAPLPPPPIGVRYVGVAAGWSHNLVLRSDGAIVAWGGNWDGECDVPTLRSGLRYVQVSTFSGSCVARYEGCPTCEPPFCLGDGGSGSVTCPCGNDGARGRGCENSASTGGAKLATRGSVEPDRVVLEAIRQPPSSASLFFQGSAVLETPVVFGDGARCIGGALKRLGVKTAVGGASSYPGMGDLAVRARSAALGDPIPLGTYRYYQVLYRDSSPSFCNPATFNASNAVMVAW